MIALLQLTVQPRKQTLQKSRNATKRGLVQLDQFIEEAPQHTSTNQIVRYPLKILKILIVRLLCRIENLLQKDKRAVKEHLIVQPLENLLNRPLQNAPLQPLEPILLVLVLRSQQLRQ
jgi:hypothetical protein